MLSLTERLEPLSSHPMYVPWFMFNNETIIIDGTLNLAQLEVLVEYIKEHGYKEIESC